ncbi:hypothetical protein [Lysobacter sp. A421]
MNRYGWVALLAVLALSACSGDGDASADGGDAAAREGDRTSLLSRVFSGGDRGHDFADIPKGAWTDLVGQLTQADDLDAAVAATREILARSGIATRDGERELVAAHAPAASFTVTPRETVHMAMEARDRGVRARLEVAEFAHMLASFGWEFPNAQQSGNARHPSRDIEDEYTQERRREAQREVEQARQVAREAEGTEFEAWEDSVLDASQARSSEARARAERANQAVRDATRRGAKQAQSVVLAAREELTAAREELTAAREAANAARETLREGQDSRKERRDAMRQAERLQNVYASKVGPEYGAGEDFQLALERWVQAAAKAPEDPASFVPLFITEMARLQDPPVDLADPQRRVLGRPGSELPVKGAGPRSGQTRLSLLEMQLILAAFDRDAGTGNDKALVSSFEKAINGKPEQAANAIAIARGVARVASSLAGEPLDLEVEPKQLHRPEDESMQVKFTATGAADEAARLHWRLVAGAPVHAQWSLRNNEFQLEGAHQSGSPARVSSSESEGDYIVDIRTESGHHGTEARGYVTAYVGAEDPSSPSLDDWWKEGVNRGFQRTPEELAEMINEGAPRNRGFLRTPEELQQMLAAWLEETSTPRAYASVEVSYHCANPTTIHLYVTDPVADGGGDGGEACTFTFATRDAFLEWREANGG